MKTRIIVSLIFCFNFLFLYSNSFLDLLNRPQKEFINKSIDIDHVEIFFQDSIGRIWAGSWANGILMFDGETFVNKTPSIINHGVRCKFAINNAEFFIGTQNGLYLFNLKTFDMKLVPDTETDILGLYRINSEELLVFCVNKIISLNLNSLKIKEELSWDDFRLVMYSLSPDGEIVLLTDKKGLYTYIYSQKKISPIALTGFSPRNELLLTLICDDQYFWIGSDKGLLKYNSRTKETVRIREMEDITVKSLMKAKNGEIWIGTSDGLYIYYPFNQEWEHYFHDNRNERSLLSNCVWSIYEDADENKWLGVDGGVSFVNEKQPFWEVKWNDLINTHEGNRILEILHDSNGHYWFGGINGLGFYSTTTGKSSFFKIKGVNKITNNRIRSIYEDKDGIIWIGTDGGLAWFNEKLQSFIPCNVEDPISGMNATWTYGIVEDKQGNLCLATCSGGIFIVDKTALKNSKNGLVAPKYNYYFDASDQYKINKRGCMGIIRDSIGNIWVNGDLWIYKIEKEGGEAIQFSSATELALPNKAIRGLLCSQEGVVWGFYQAGFFTITPSNNHVAHIPADNYVKEYGEINSMVECGDNIWFLTSKGVGIINKSTLIFKHVIDFADSKYKSCYYDPIEKLIWLGGVDNCLVLDPEACLKTSDKIYSSVIISTVYVNDQPVVTPSQGVNGHVISKEDISSCGQLDLLPNDNSLSFRLSFGRLIRGTELQPGYYYRLTGLDNSWKELSMQNPLIEYPYLNYGTYCLEIGKMDKDRNQINIVRTLNIRLQAPWYHTVWFRLLIFTIIFGLFIAGFNYYRTRTKLKIAEMDKVNTMKLSQMKMDFLTSMSHELKTPLSLILAPVNNLLGSTKNAQSKALLQTILKNTMQLSTMVSQIINFKDDSVSQPNLTISHLEIVEFVRSIIFVHQEMFHTKGIHLEFTSNIEKLYIKADVLKLESVVNNLISNAYKFTETGGYVTANINYPSGKSPSLLELKISDNGIGIPAEDIPHIFDRFYQSGKSIHLNKEGSGIGLSMSKNYIAQHGGEINVTSSDCGSTFTVYLPVEEKKEDITSATISFDNFIEIGENNHQSIRILIVEDNVEIAKFIGDNLKGMQCTIVHNGKSGLEAALQLLPDIIIADVMMPVMDGIEMSRLVKRNLSTSTIPIILLTAKDDKHTELDAYKLGIDAFLSKPFDISHLIARINQITKNKSLLVNKVLQLENKEPENIESIMSQDEMFMENITHIIEEHLENQDLNVQKLAEISGYNAKMIYRRIKLLTGNTAVDYIKSIRMKKAAMLLSQKKFTVSEVMYKVGFTNHSYFSKCFVEKYAKTPKVYMDEFENG